MNSNNYYDILGVSKNATADENVVLFPKKYTNYKKINRSSFEILIIKTRTEEDKNRMVRNELGQIVEETTTNSKWIIIEKQPYQIEETFWVFGYNKFTERFDTRKIITDILLKGIRRKYMVKEVVVVYNKLIIQSDLDDFNLILCKCQDDAIRLHNALKQAVSKSKIKNILFFGLAKPKQISDMYKIIMEHTGWNLKQTKRSSTRH